MGEQLERFLVLHLFGPLQSWGPVAVGEHRGDEGRPTKSAVLGLLGAALGLSREEADVHEDLHRTLGFAVRVDAPGIVLKDYHTSQVPGSRKGKRWYTRREELGEQKLNTVLSDRYYRADACFTVVLWMREEGAFSLARLSQALARPRFHLYLGRKSCPPAWPLIPKIVEAPNLKVAFTEAPLPQLLREQVRGPRGAGRGQRVYWEGHDDSLTTQHLFHRRDGLASRRRWLFHAREERGGLLEPEGEAAPDHREGRD